jgi:hypothetical protein
MKYSLLLLFLLPLFVSAQTPAKKEGPAFDIADFNRKFETVKWLVAYDEVAWKTSDLVMAGDKTEMARLGREWFCFQDAKSAWHAVYGKLENNKFEQVFHFVVDREGKIVRTTDKIDEKFLAVHARALALAQAKLKATVPSGSPIHNPYIKQNADKTFTVWLFPAFQPNRMAVFGGEFIYTVDAAGEKITKDESYFQGEFRGFATNPPREIWLNYKEKEKPTLGAIFFVWCYKEYFTKIFIDNSVSASTVMRDDKKGYFWVHVAKGDVIVEVK